nr:alkane hydroxylase MAH1-like [Ipomoea trifida]
MFAGRDTSSTTLTWLFYLLAQNPLAQANVRDEIQNKLNLKQEVFNLEECDKLVYLHAALCESLRLFPPVAIQHKVSAGMDILPSGHLVKPNTRILLSFYSLGRMNSIWGEDCMEFKPERWISDKGRIKHEPSYKFPAFNAGPRTCLGKEMTFVQMKIIVVFILHHYEFEVVDSHSVSPSDSIIIEAKHGLKVKFTKRSIWKKLKFGSSNLLKAFRATHPTKLPVPSSLASDNYVGDGMSSDMVLPRNWAVVGMMPGLLKNAHRVHEFATDVLKHSGGTFEFKGPAAFPNLNMLVTSHPANIHHVLSKNFSNYPKGPQFRKIFDILGDGVFNVDSQLWEFHRKTTLSFFNHAQFYTLLEKNVWHKVEKGLLPVLGWFAEQGAEFDLQDVFQRFTFDTISMLLLHHDPQSLCLGLPYLPCEKAFKHATDAVLYRHIFPETFWKLQKWVGIGKEKKLIQACRTFDVFIYSAIKRLELIMTTNINNNDDSSELSLFTAYVQAYKQQEQVLTGSSLNKFMRDTLLSLMFAGRDTSSTTLTWLFYLLAQNPLAQANVRDEIENKLNLKQEDKRRIFNLEECDKLVYLHAALCESLRLFPPVAIQHKVKDAWNQYGAKIAWSSSLKGGFQTKEDSSMSRLTSFRHSMPDPELV